MDKYTVPTLAELVEKSIKEGPKNNSEIKLRTHGRIDAAALAGNLQKGIKNTDKEIWRKIKDDYSSPSIHVTKLGDIGINVGEYVLVAPVEQWHEAMFLQHKYQQSLKIMKANMRQCQYGTIICSVMAISALLLLFIF